MVFENETGNVVRGWIRKKFASTASSNNQQMRPQDLAAVPSFVAFDEHGEHLSRSRNEPARRAAAFRVWQREVVRMYEEEGASPPRGEFAPPFGRQSGTLAQAAALFLQSRSSLPILSEWKR